MIEKDSILMGIRERVVGTPYNDEFDVELTAHINSALAELNQNGIGKFIFVDGEEQTWTEFKDETQIKGNKYFQMVPLFVSLSTKMLFDPPPPSSVEYHSNSIVKLLWRLKIAYEE